MKIRNHCLCSWFVILLAAILLVPAHAQFIQQGPKLTGTNYFGISGGISTDGNTAVVGAGDGAFVYVRINGVWSQQGPELGGASGYYCQAVALSGDGNTVLVGFLDTNIDSIRVRVFIRTNGVWSQQGTDLLPSGRYGYLYGALLGSQGMAIPPSSERASGRGMDICTKRQDMEPTTAGVQLCRSRGRMERPIRRTLCRREHRHRRRAV